MNLDLGHAVHYHDGQFPPSKLDFSRLLPELLQATDALARYDEALKTMHNSEIFLAPLRNQEAVVSSRMEGTISTMDEILQLDAEYAADDEQPTLEQRSDAVETILYARSLHTAQLQIQEGRPLTSSLLKSIHQQLLSFGRGATKSPGALKTEQNYIGDEASGTIHFVPIAPEKLETGMEALFKLIGDKSIPVLIRTALAHVEFEALHPFKDGNGRVGRVLITLMLWAEGAISAPHFYISRYFEDHKKEYVLKMRAVSADNKWEDWCSFFLDAVAQQAQYNLEITSNIRGLYEQMKERFATLLSSKYSLHALDYVFTYPVFRNSHFTKDSGIPSQTANRFTSLLLDEGLLQIVRPASGRRSSLLRFEPLMKLVRI
ncbi:MAG: Fic family protein [Verrucomicrobiota bacterium JB022]|nr:Fic family protein [Verrucomicrobiota bacterium JB022]